MTRARSTTTTSRRTTLRREPQRTCVGCRRVRPSRELVRFVMTGTGPAPGNGAPGRGAWLCPQIECAERALRKGAMARALRVDRSTVDDAAAKIRSALTVVAGPPTTATGPPGGEEAAEGV
jgi:uncharacterized protein